LLFGLIQKLRKELPANRLVYINFEDDRLFPVDLNTMDLFLQAYYELYPDNRLQKVYFFFDEVQVIDNWELFIRRLYDTEKCSIFVTGSSSGMMTREVSTALRGRNITFEVFPLSFREYLQFRDIEIKPFSSKAESRIIHGFDDYLNSTAFPELVSMETNLKRKSLKEYLDLIIYKDIVEKYRVSNIHLMKYLIKFLFSNSANLISVNKIYNELKSSGLNVSRNSVYEYISYLEDSYTLFAVPLFTRNLREQHRNPRKYFALDTGLRKMVTLAEDKGKLLESVVYMHLRRSSETVYYYLSNQELDFLTSGPDGIRLFNVSYDMTSATTRQRELQSLFRAMTSLDRETALLLTADEEGEEISGERTIKIMPVWNGCSGTLTPES